MVKMVPVQIKIDNNEKLRWQKLALENGFISIPTMVRFLVVQFEKSNKKYLADTNMLDNLMLVEKIKKGKERLFVGDVDQLAEKYGN
jgi:hypothetical protein